MNSIQPFDPGEPIDGDALNRLSVTLNKIPTLNWEDSLIPAVTIVDLLMACAATLRASGQHRAAEQLDSQRRQFMADRPSAKQAP